MLKPLIAAVLAVILTPVAAFAEWTYTDGGGKTVTLPDVPKRLVMHANVAAGLIPLGIRPIGIFVDSAVEDDNSLRGLDLTGIEILGEAWGEIDIEKLAAAKPDLILGEYWPLEKVYSGMEAGGANSTLIEQIAPVVGPIQGNSIEGLIKDYEAFATLLGADLSDPQIAADKAKFEAAKATFQAAVEAKPGLTVLAIWAGADGLYVAAADGSAELSDFRNWGLGLIVPEVADDRGYWETVSWENADKYQPDLIIVDDRAGTKTREAAEAQPTWPTIRAAKAGQVGAWPAFWMRNYNAYAEQLDKLTATINASDENLGD